MGCRVCRRLHRIGVFVLYYTKRKGMKRLAVTGLHIAYWGLYFLLLILFQLVLFHTVHATFRGFWRAIVFSPGTIFTSLPAILTFYIFYLLLFPRLLQQKRLLMLGLTGIGVSLASTILAFITINRFLFPWLKNG